MADGARYCGQESSVGRLEPLTIAGLEGHESRSSATSDRYVGLLFGGPCYDLLFGSIVCFLPVVEWLLRLDVASQGQKSSSARQSRKMVEMHRQGSMKDNETFSLNAILHRLSKGGFSRTFVPSRIHSSGYPHSCPLRLTRLELIREQSGQLHPRSLGMTLAGLKPLP